MNFYWTLNRLEHHFLNIKLTGTCSSFGNQTQAPYYLLWVNRHATQNILWPITSFARFVIKHTQHHFIEHRKDKNENTFSWIDTVSIVRLTHTYKKRSEKYAGNFTPLCCLNPLWKEQWPSLVSFSNSSTPSKFKNRFCFRMKEKALTM